LKDAIPLAWRKMQKTMNVPDKAISFDEEIHLQTRMVFRKNRSTTHVEVIASLLQWYDLQ
jgi:hypothetical protein